MRVVVIGTGAIGSAVIKLLAANGCEVLSVGRTSGTYQADISNPASLRALFGHLGQFDAVANAAGDAFPGPFEQVSDEQWAKSLAAKGMGQVNLVRAALPYISDGGSFTLVSGALTNEFIRGGTVLTAVNHFVEGFVKGAAVELPRGIRINCVSPTVLVESPHFQKLMPGFPPVPAAEVAMAYLRAIANPMTGRVLKLYKTDC
jgi:NAD(P)-dependent dehydrogenase (short-subunit alcohol dehydrogenase family)